MIFFAYISPETARNVLLVIVGGCYLCYRLFHLWRWLRAKTHKVSSAKVVGDKETMPTVSVVKDDCSHKCLSSQTDLAKQSDCSAERVSSSAVQQNEEEPVHCSPQPPSQTPPSSQPQVVPPSTTTSDLSGEELYAQARAMPHRQIPDCEHDGEYLKLLAKSAEQGCSKALAKLGEYAMRRGTWVEAYYWMSRARRSGMPNVDAVLREIRKCWTLNGAHSERENVYELFSEDAGSIGRAFLNIDSGRDSYAAKEFLRSNYPEFIDA